jgi:hypothetical protein
MLTAQNGMPRSASPCQKNAERGARRGNLHHWQHPQVPGKGVPLMSPADLWWGKARWWGGLRQAAGLTTRRSWFQFVPFVSGRAMPDTCTAKERLQAQQTQNQRRNFSQLRTPQFLTEPVCLGRNGECRREMRRLAASDRRGSGGWRGGKDLSFAVHLVTGRSSGTACRESGRTAWHFEPKPAEGHCLRPAHFPLILLSWKPYCASSSLGRARGSDSWLFRQ